MKRGCPPLLIKTTGMVFSYSLFQEGKGGADGAPTPHLPIQERQGREIPKEQGTLRTLNYFEPRTNEKKNSINTNNYYII